MIYDADLIREMEATSIRRFVESCSDHFTGRVLDYGCGNQPYRDIIEAVGGIYYGYDSPAYPGAVRDDEIGDQYDALQPEAEWDAILCTQVMQYVPGSQLCCVADAWGASAPLLWRFREAVRDGGVLVLTYPTSWEDFEEGDLWRFTRQGMTRLLVDAGFVIERHEARAQVELGGFAFRLGYGVVCRAA